MSCSRGANLKCVCAMGRMRMNRRSKGPSHPDDRSWNAILCTFSQPTTRLDEYSKMESRRAHGLGACSGAVTLVVRYGTGRGREIACLPANERTNDLAFSPSLSLCANQLSSSRTPGSRCHAMLCDAMRRQGGRGLGHYNISWR